MTSLSIFRTLASPDSRLGFYTIETQERIPALPGCYAWFLPLWLYVDSLDKIVERVMKIVDYEPKPEKTVSAEFQWQSVEFGVQHRARLRSVSEGDRATWQRLVANPPGRDALERCLLEASLLMPPLYVGRTNNLRRRYLEHTDLVHDDYNKFNKRFLDHMRHLEIKLRVSDLLFVCVKTPSDLESTLGVYGSGEVESLIEHLLMQFCRPAYSLR